MKTLRKALSHCTRQHLAALGIAIAAACHAGTVLAEGGKLVLNMRDADIRSMVQWVADVTGKNLIVHKDVQGKVTVLSAEPVTPEQAYQVFLSALEVNGFAAVESGGAIKIVPQAMANSSSPQVSHGVGGETVITVIRAKNVPASQLATNLRPLVPQAGMLTAYPETNSLIVASSATNVQRVNELVKILDQAGNLQFETIRLQHANAQDVQKNLEQLIPAIQGSEGYKFVNLAVDTRTNTILMGGDPTNRGQVRNIIASLDQEVAGGNTDVIYLKYVQADEMLAILKGVAEALQGDAGPAAGGQQGGSGGGSKVSIEASKSTNALIVNAPPAIVAKMRSIVEQVDIRRAQVLVEALVVEVTDDDAKDLGISWIGSEHKGFPSEGGNIAVNTLGANLKTGAGLDAKGNVTLAPGGGLTLGYIDNGDLKAVMRALSTTTKANILSTPTIVALDNEEAELLVGQNVPFKTGQSTSQASSVDNPFTTIERQDIGINLVIKPQINQGDSITLDLKQSAEDIAPSNTLQAETSDIVTNKRMIKTKALIKDMQTLVIGGLLQDKESEQRTKTPILGDIPLIGGLFSSKGKTRGKTNLMVFIRPTILKDDAQIAELTRQRYEFMRSAQDTVLKPEQPFAKESSPILPEFETFSPAGSR
jgi:general secretion pathway protein D